MPTKIRESLEKIRPEIETLVRELLPTIADDYRAPDDDGDDPSMQLTIGADASGGWNYQTGDNSFTGGAYGFQDWGVTTIGRDSDPAEVADDLLRQLDEAIAESDDDDDDDEPADCPECERSNGPHYVGPCHHDDDDDDVQGVPQGLEELPASDDD